MPKILPAVRPHWSRTYVPPPLPPPELPEGVTLFQTRLPGESINDTLKRRCSWVFSGPLLARQVRDDLKAGEDAARDRLRRYRSAGLTLIRAKARCPHGEWGPWLAEHVTISDRHARRLMEFAKTDVTSDLEAEEAAWTRICGNAPADHPPQLSGKRKADAAEPKLSADRDLRDVDKCFTMMLPEGLGAEIDAALRSLRDRWKTGCAAVEAVRFALKETASA
jgi:hypothetical protein